jgi:hypothetical protein
MTKKFIYLLFKDGEGGEPKEPETDEGKEGEDLGEGGEGKEPKNEPKSEPKKQTKKTEKKVSITAKEFEEYKQFKLNSMSAEERENALKEENESLLTKIGVLENTIETQTKEIERVKAQDSIKEKLGTIKSEKPYLIETLDKRASKGFNSVDEVNEFVNLIDSPTLKEAYDVLQKTQKATKITSKNVVGTSNNDNNVNTKKYSNYDLSKYGIRVRK